MMRRLALLCALTILVASFAGEGRAQNATKQPAAATPATAVATPADTNAPPQPAASANASVAPVAAIPPGELDPNNMAPLVFSYWEHAAINDARDSRGLVRPPTDDELMRSLHQPPTEKVKPPAEERELTLNGIVYVSNGDWTIWLNGKRVTPEALPKEALDLKVYKEYVEMKWFDDYTNQIFPIRLHPHERFNLDTRIFLPG